MNFANFFASPIRGWLPEEPKMPKRWLRKTLPPVAVLVVVTTIVSLISPSVFFPNQTVALAAPPAIVSNAPNSSYVELWGVEHENTSFILVLTNGNHVWSKNMTLTFSLTRKSGNKCTVHLTVECGNFSNEASVDGNIIDGNLVIDSRRSLFLINPDVTKSQNIMLTESNGWKLGGNVRSLTAKSETAIDPYRVTAITVISASTRTEKGWPLTLRVGYDPNTGILIYSMYSLSDVLLEKLGIELLIGGLKLGSYSENLQLEVANLPPPGTMTPAHLVLYILSFSSPVIVPVVAVVVYLLHRRRKRRQADVHSVLEVNDNIKQSCEVGD